MALVGVIASFATGTYTVTRQVTGSFVDGDFAPGAESTFQIQASIQPVDGKDLLELLDEGQQGEQIKLIFTTTELRTVTADTEPDVITIDGEPWRIIRVKRWEAFGGNGSGDHYEAYAARLQTP